MAWPWVVGFGISSGVSLLPVRLRPVSPEIAAGFQVTALPLAHSLYSGGVQITYVFAWTQISPPRGLCQPCSVDSYCWLLLHWADSVPACLSLPGSPPQCLFSGLIESPRTFFFCSSSFLSLILDSFSVGPVSYCYKWISISQAWNPSYSSRNWHLFKPDLELAELLDFITSSVGRLGTLAIH